MPDDHGDERLQQTVGVRTTVSFVVAFAAAVPFMHTEVFVGAAARRLHGADVAYFVNFLVAAVLYGSYRVITRSRTRR